MAKGPVKITVKTINLRLPITSSSGELSPATMKEIMKIMALLSMNKIWDRVKRGEDLSGARFKPYTDAYYYWKKSKGRAPETEGDWLTLSGQMMGSLSLLFYGARQFTVGFAGNRVGGLSNSLLAWINQEKYQRFFVGLTEKEQTDVIAMTITEATTRGLLDALKPRSRKGRKR